MNGHSLKAGCVLVYSMLLVILDARADVTFQEQASFKSSIVNAHTTTIRRISGNKERSETRMSCSGNQSCRDSESIEVVHVDRGVTWDLRQQQRTYTEFPFPSVEKLPAQLVQRRAFFAQTQSCARIAQPEVLDNSKCRMSEPVLTVNSTQNRVTIIGREAKQTNLTLTQRCQTQNAEADCNVVYTLDLWLSDEDLPGIGDQQSFERAYSGKMRLAPGAIDMLEVSALLGVDPDNLKRLGAAGAQLKGYPLKTSFRLAVSGAPCAPGSSQDSSAPSGGLLADAGKSATADAVSSTSFAARWETTDAVRNATGGGIAGYVAGSTAGGFAQSMVGGLFAKKRKAEPPATSALNAAQPKAEVSVAEFNVETVGLDSGAVPPDQFEIPPGWRKLTKPEADKLHLNCQT